MGEEICGRAPAPGGLAAVQAFVNTADVEAGTDELATLDALRAWLAARNLLAVDAAVAPADLTRAVAVREGLREVLLGHAGHPVDAEVVQRLNDALADVALHAVFDAGGGCRIEPAKHGVEAALGRVLGFVAQAVEDGTWPRLKACSKDSCRWAFYDASRNRSGRWCSMAVCGNREKMRRAYAARRTSH
jgi:predicted RNA-binding Zn ribbon-like protein